LRGALRIGPELAVDPETAFHGVAAVGEKPDSGSGQQRRAERCIARWKREPPDAGTTRPHAPAADAGREGRPAPMSVVLAQTMRINALEERLRRLELSMADGTAR